MRHLTQKIPTCWYLLRYVTQKCGVGGPKPVPNANGFANGFALKWNIGFKTLKLKIGKNDNLLETPNCKLFRKKIIRIVKPCEMRHLIAYDC